MRPLVAQPLLLIPIILLTALFGDVKGQGKNYDGILKTLKHPEKLVFDVSESVNDKALNVYQNVSLVKAGIQLTPVIYCDAGWISENASHYFRGHPLQKFFQEVWKIVPEKIERRKVFSFMFPSSHAILNGGDTTENVTPILSIRGSPMPFSGAESEQLKKLTTTSEAKWKNSKFGMEFDLGSTMHNYSLDLISYVDVLIFHVDIPFDQFILSYSLFRERLRRKLDQNYESLGNTNPNGTIYVKLNFPGTSEPNLNLSDELYQKYYYYLLQFSVFWLNDGERERLILKTFENRLSYQAGLDGTELKELLVVDTEIKLETVNDQVCEMKALMDHLSTLKLKKMNIRRYSLKLTERGKPKAVDDNLYKCILTNVLGSECPTNVTERQICNRPSAEYYPLPDINLVYYVTPNPPMYKYEFPVIRKALSDLPWKQAEVDLVLHEIPPSLDNISIACLNWEEKDVLQSDEKFLKAVLDQCIFMWDQANVIVWHVVFHYGKNVSEQDLTRRLLQLELKRQKFLQLYPRKGVLLRAEFRKKQGATRRSRGSFGLYCHSEMLTINQGAEVLINFARLHSIPFEIRDVLGYYKNVGWSALATVDELNATKTRFPVFVARNYPDKFLNGEFHTDPCLSWTKEAPSEAIQMDLEYTGTTLHMSGMKEGHGSITSDELEIMLLFALHKFSLIEIIPSSFTDLNTLLDVLSNHDFIKRLALEESQPAKLYLRIESNLELILLLEKLPKVKLKLTGIHFEPTNETEEIGDLLLQQLKANGILWGTLLEDCVNEVNNHFEHVQTLPMFMEADYLVCNIRKPTRATNINKVEVAKYLDTTLYIQKYFQRMFPNEKKDMLFRLNAVQNSSDFLRFFSDVSQFGSLYKMKLFMVPTFDDVSGDQHGWWKISDFGSIFNASVFVEKEAEYLGRKTWKPYQDVEIEVDLKTLIITMVLCIAMALLAGAALLLRVWYRRRFALLTEKEVDIFRLGKFEDGDNLEHTFDCRSFPKDFEIPSSKFMLLNIIGKGNFGLVYNAMLSDGEGGRLPVAVKIPHPDCSKEVFTSLLSELKILANVGSHPHVLQFIGAYTKEIGRGIAYIATELCENGALQEYLRTVHSASLSGGAEQGRAILKPNLYDLCRFSFEIALGMEYIANKKILHGDLSARNVLLDSELHCKIADFGLSRKLYEGQICLKTTSEPLAWRWLSIESLKRMEFTTKSDVWSYGVTLWEIFSLGCLPYPGPSSAGILLEELENGIRLPAPEFSTHEIFNMMLTCWDSNPEKRPSFADLSQFFSALLNKEYAMI